jgi:RNA polymerase sigma factor (sigma-70 family)|tara:strand:+ start:94 stop:1083 length:990 start_codon:yes stop_codon:yes gene_type:complete
MSKQLHITFTAVSGPENFKSFACPLGDDQFSIGRGSAATLVLADPSVSREHAILAVEEGRVVVQDCGSSGGTSINMMRLDADEWVRLRDRDILLVGPWKILVHIEGDAPADSVADEPAESKSVEPPEAKIKGGKGDPLYATRASIFLKIKAGTTQDRELGWNEFADKYSRIIAGFSRNAGLPAQEADDVLQDVLMGFFRVSDRFEYDPKKGRFRGYLKRVTLNAIRARHRKKRPSIGFDDTVDPPVASDLDAAWDRQWTEQILKRAMGEARNEVEERTWQSFELYGVRGVPAEEVAKETGMTPAAIRHAKMRITRRVREIVERLRNDEG